MDFKFKLNQVFVMRGVTLAQPVKLLSCDWKVVQVLETTCCVKNKVRLRTNTKWWDPFPWPCVCGSFNAPGCPFFFQVFVMI